MARDETPDPHLDPDVMQARREAFTDGYAQAVQDAQSWVQILPDISTGLLTEKLLANSFGYRNMLVNALAIDKAIAEAEAGRTVDRGDFTQYLEGENDCTA